MGKWKIIYMFKSFHPALSHLDYSARVINRSYSARRDRPCGGFHEIGTLATSSFVVPRETVPKLVRLRDVMDGDWRYFSPFCQAAGSVRCVWRQGVSKVELRGNWCRTGRRIR